MAPDIERVEVTPEIAHEWLGFNTHNRKLRHRVITMYAADMRDGKWQWNGESIKFSRSGDLLDGQHRLAAIVEADVKVPMLVVRGLPPETQETVDGGAKRKFSDVLQLRGEPNYTSLSALVRRVALWKAGFRDATSTFTPSVAYLLQTLEEHPELRASANAGDHTARGCGLPSSICGFCHWLFNGVHGVDSDDVEHFFMRLHDGQNLAKSDPIYELRRTVEESKSVRGQRSTTYLTAITIKAWNAYREGRQIALLRWRRGGAKPEPFPEPV